jgi:hypothetical protein
LTEGKKQAAEVQVPVEWLGEEQGLVEACLKVWELLLLKNLIHPVEVQPLQKVQIGQIRR